MGPKQRTPSSKASTPTPSAASSTTKPAAVPQTPSSSSTTSKKPTKPSVSSKASLTSKDTYLQIGKTIYARYVEETPQRLKLTDAFMAFLMGLGALQFVYVCLVGNYPFNAFLAGFSATVGQFVLTASLRMQTNPANKAEFFIDESVTTVVVPPGTTLTGGGGKGGDKPKAYKVAKSRSDERAFADYVFGSLLLHVLCVNFIN